ncbi:MAG: hypothetical protein OEP95_06825 [Myxococcales bacterium]|nr:hypothetical protein [Myxococcales bacterium]
MASASARGVLGGLLLALLCGAPSVSAQEIPMEVTVVRISPEPGPADPRAKRLDRILKGQLAYQSLGVLAVKKRSVALDDVWKVNLPGTGPLRVRPVDIGPNGALLSLDWEGELQGDFRVRKGTPLILGGPRSGQGKLVVVIDTR